MHPPPPRRIRCSNTARSSNLLARSSFQLTKSGGMCAEGAAEFGGKHGVKMSALKASPPTRPLPLSEESSETPTRPASPVQTTLRALLIFFKGAARKHLSQAFVQEDLVRFGPTPPEPRHSSPPSQGSAAPRSNRIPDC